MEHTAWTWAIRTVNQTAVPAATGSLCILFVSPGLVLGAKLNINLSLTHHPRNDRIMADIP